MIEFAFILDDIAAVSDSSPCRQPDSVGWRTSTIDLASSRRQSDVNNASAVRFASAYSQMAEDARTPDDQDQPIETAREKGAGLQDILQAVGNPSTTTRDLYLLRRKLAWERHPDRRFTERGSDGLLSMADINSRIDAAIADKRNKRTGVKI